jgi:hypothetical protein
VELGALLVPIFALVTRSGAELVPFYRDSNTAPATVARLRAETATMCRDRGEDVCGFPRWAAAKRAK